MRIAARLTQTCEACPVQFDVEVDGAWLYFRARCGAWSLVEVGESRADDVTIIEGTCAGEFHAGYMPLTTARALIRWGVQVWRANRREEPEADTRVMYFDETRKKIVWRRAEEAK